nr:hypothetical protein CFP56_60581 [Quercus suber]
MLDHAMRLLWTILKMPKCIIKKNEDIQTDFDDAIEIDDTQDMYEEFIDNEGPEDNPEFVDELQVENNVNACPNPNPNPDWFT